MSTFQYWWRKLQGNDQDQTLKYEIKKVFEEHNGNYGVRQVTVIIRNRYEELGKSLPNHKKIQRLMRDLGLKYTKYNKQSKKYYPSKEPQGKIAKNRLGRRNMTNWPYQKLVCDVTELKIQYGDKVYLEVIMDLYSNRILEMVGWDKT